MTGQINVNKIAARTGTAITVESGHVITQPGSIVQTVSGSTSTLVNVASTSFADTGLTANITPKFSTSKILIIISQNVMMDIDDNEGYCKLQLMRDSTVIQSQARVAMHESGGANKAKDAGPYSVTHLDSPSSTSSITYKTQGLISSTSNNGTARFQINSSVSHITLMEIVA